MTRRRALLAGALGAALPGTARAESRFFATSDGVRLHYLEAGQGPTIVFIPGWCMPAWIFTPQVEALSRRHRVVVLDPRGQGQSAVPAGGYEPGRRGRDIGDLIGRLGPGRVVLAGWSLGVLDALSWLNQSGDAKLAGLVLIDNSVGEGVPPPPRQSNFFANLRRARNTTVQGFCASMFKTPQTPAYLAALSRDAQKMPVDASIALLSYPRPREFWRDSLYSTRRPVLYAVTPRFRGQAELVASRHAAATADIYDDAGHALFVDAAGRFNASLDAFLPRAAWR
ncbi:alpha/beta fold hydrolase [Humitalea sp. 24SJ18S-53]|uniref:alpha/beta fold hydrolase n=1 Tax=Humitalea sp. 24SJ18S-53 TaxID=3422307 RepID=UPI003D67D8B4